MFNSILELNGCNLKSLLDPLKVVYIVVGGSIPVCGSLVGGGLLGNDVKFL